MKQQTILAFTLALLLLPGAIFCQNRKALTGNGTIIEVPLPEISDFDALSIVDINGDTYIEVGPETSLRIEVSENLAYLLDVQQKGNELQICMPTNKNNRLWLEETGVKVFITTPTLEKLVFDDNGYCEVRGLTAPKLNIQKIGNGDLRLNGSVSELKLKRLGNGTVHAQKLMVKEADVWSEGNGSVYLNVSESLTTNRMGNGSIYNEGMAKLKTHVNTGNGNVYSEHAEKEKHKPEPATRQVVEFTIANKSARQRSLEIKGETFSYGIGIMPFGRRKESLPVGTKIKTDFGKTLYIVKAEDAGKTIQL
jgi:hypothetical protein